jgi:ABC-type polysaccharide/polyol phosphate export permease
MNEPILRQPGLGRTHPAALDRSRIEHRRIAQALNDIKSGAGRWWIWSSLASQDIRERYRGSVLGPFWLTLSMAIMIGTLGLVYSALFNISLDDYLPFLTLGLLFWTFISTILTDACTCFISAGSVIHQVRMPFTVHVCRTLYRNLLILAHNAVVAIIVLAWFRTSINRDALLVLPGVLALLANGVWACFLLGMICARFRDVVPIVSSVVQIVFFLTPILWQPGSLGGRHSWIVDWNPFYAMIEIVRAPLLGQATDPRMWFFVFVVTAVGWTAAFVFFARFRARIPFWV